MCLKKIILASAIFLPLQRKSEFQRPMKGIYQPVKQYFCVSGSNLTN